MGANFVQLRYHGEDKEKIIAEFRRDQENDRYENGHIYSGGIGMATGLHFERDKEFDTEQEAYDYLLEAAQKWEDAVAVKLKGTHTWLVAAWCSS